MTYRYGQHGYTDSATATWTPYGDEASNESAVTQAGVDLLDTIHRLESIAHTIEGLPFTSYTITDAGQIPGQHRALTAIILAAESARTALRAIQGIGTVYDPDDTL